MLNLLFILAVYYHQVFTASVTVERVKLQIKGANYNGSTDRNEQISC